VVTGAAANIGLGIATRLVQESVRVIALDKDGAGLETLRRELGCSVLQVDFSEVNGRALGQELVHSFGPVDYVVNNVGIRNDETFITTTPAELARVFDVNLFNPWLMTREIVEDLIERRQGGSVVWISSVHDHRRRGYPAYSASKAAISMLVVEMAAELGPHAIRVNAVSPGSIRVGSHRDTEGDRVIPLGKSSGAPADVATVVSFLLTDALYVSGANLVVDGALSTHSWVDDRPGPPASDGARSSELPTRPPRQEHRP
jgi:NAD(P)-dependent dehydrogenase (short-subunit alcohol dehydrogenase family)